LAISSWLLQSNRKQETNLGGCILFFSAFDNKKQRGLKNLWEKEWN